MAKRQYVNFVIEVDEATNQIFTQVTDHKIIKGEFNGTYLACLARGIVASIKEDTENLVQLGSDRLDEDWAEQGKENMDEDNGDGATVPDDGTRTV